MRAGSAVGPSRASGVQPAAVVGHPAEDDRVPLAIDHGVRLVLHCSAHFRDESFHSWHHFSVCRAVENQIYLLSLNQAGENYGNSIFCTPWIDEHSPGLRFPQTAERFESIGVDADVIERVRRKYSLLDDRVDDYCGFALL